MSYDDTFYTRYQAYLNEPTVRRNHDRALDFFADFMPPERKVVDLGCGTGEYRQFGAYAEYVGIDKVPGPAVDTACDYECDLPELPFEPNVFVSLFSIEACMPESTRRYLYASLFRQLPLVQSAITSGFYYEDKAREEAVRETGGLTSYQSILRLHEFESEIYDETHLIMRTPSKMFGDNVIEVWKLLEKRNG